MKKIKEFLANFVWWCGVIVCTPFIYALALFMSWMEGDEEEINDNYREI